MYFLKCNHCGKLNEASSQYLIFCSECHKKIENNYSDWQKRNPDKNPDDFHRLVCITESDIPVSKPKRSFLRNKSLKFLMGSVVFFAIFYAAGTLGGEELVRLFKKEKTGRQVLEQQWVKEKYGEYGLVVETPVKLAKGDIALPAEVRAVIDQMDVYNYMSAKGFKIYIASAKYNPVIGQANLQGAAAGSINEVKMSRGVTDLDFTEDYNYKNGIPGFIQKGTYKQDGIEITFINSGYAKGLNFWQILVAYQTGDEIGRIASERVMESVEINMDRNSL